MDKSSTSVQTPSQLDDASGKPARTDIEFDSHGDTIRAWLFQPGSDALNDDRGTPLIVMGHGLSLTRDSGLTPYAETFAEAGCFVLVMDYRGFGDSDGEPRELVSVNNQLEDYAAAIDAARRLDGVDPERIALWGTSYSGGIVVETAARDRRIAAIVAQVPNLDNLATLLYMLTHTPIRQLIRSGISIVRDALRGVLRRPPYYMRSIGRAGENAAFVSDEYFEQVEQIRGPTFKNRFAPRDFLRFPPFRPIRRVRKLPCRAMFVAAERDDLTPTAPVLKAARIAGDRAELLSFPVGHFGVYAGDTLRENVQAQREFFVRELGAAGRTG